MNPERSSFMNMSRRKQGLAARVWTAAALAGLALGFTGPALGESSAIASNFNGTPIGSGDSIWFNSVLHPKGLSKTGTVVVCITNQVISYEDSSGPQELSVPDAQITFNPDLDQANTFFDGSMWSTSAPSFHVAGNTFLSGLAFQPEGGFPGGVHDIVWSAQFQSDTNGVSLEWKWAAAAYRSFSDDYNALMVKPVDDNKASVYLNSDHAGTPEAFKANVTGGATGGGGSNFTGSLSGTASVVPSFNPEGSCGEQF
jgi:hypothetical protein